MLNSYDVTTDNLIIGAGVIGLASGYTLLKANHETIIVEAEPQFGMGISSRNSEVIHAGIYYPTDSLKTRLCIAGRHKLYEYCQKYGIAHKKCGKFIIATQQSQELALRNLFATANVNKVENIELLSAQSVHDLYPFLECASAIYSAETGIIDSHEFMMSLAHNIEAIGGIIAYSTPVNAIVKQPQGFLVTCNSMAGEVTIYTKNIINCAGLDAIKIANLLNVLHTPKLFFCKGNYFSCNIAKNVFQHLIYPLPSAAGLGVHLTLDMSGAIKFGPDTEWVAEPTLDVNSRQLDTFYEAIRSYWPALPDNSLTPAYAGIRPKLVGPQQAAHDFVIQTATRHGVPGLVNLFGIESPGLTASLAIGEYVHKILYEKAYC